MEINNYLILPGHGGSGPEHWQTVWENADPRFRRVEQRDWFAPVCSEWVINLETAVRNTGPNTVLVAHSLGCLLVAHWAQQTYLRIAGAFLVAPPDPSGSHYPKSVIGFSPIPNIKFKFPSIVAASRNDPFGSQIFARKCSDVWGSQFVDAGSQGHINVESGHGDWSDGRSLLDAI